MNKMMRSTKKIFIEDTGLFENFGFRFMEGMGKLYENVVCSELLRKGFDVYYWSDDRSECDFIVKKGNEITMAIQVCYDLNDENVEREMDGLQRACSQLKIDKGIIITSSVHELEIDEFEIIPLYKFLLK
jgi:predicted AAA+ superfamily ATPase